MKTVLRDKKISGGKGFTLVETLIAVAIFALAMGAISTSVLMLYRAQGYSLQQSMAINEARKGVETMVKEIREAKYGDDGSYPIEVAADKEFIFYSDIDKDGATERVRYFWGTVGSGGQNQSCVTFDDGGSCSATFSNFLSGEMESAQVKVSLEGDLGLGNEYADIYADGVYLGRVCSSGCPDCAAAWQGDATFDVFGQASDGAVFFLADASSKVDNICDWQEPNHSLKAMFELSWTETMAGGEGNFKKGIIDPVGDPVEYHEEDEEISVLSSYVCNVPPIFKYFDANGNELIETPARLKDTKVMEVYLIINVNPNRAPQDFELKSMVQLRNLKEE